jgi:hypothetical protein
MKQLPLFDTYRYTPREERKDQIFAMLTEVPFSVPALVIGRWVGLKKSPHLLGILEEMCQEGTLDMEWQTTPRRQSVRCFFVPEEMRK